MSHINKYKKALAKAATDAGLSVIRVVQTGKRLVTIVQLNGKERKIYAAITPSCPFAMKKHARNCKHMIAGQI